MSTENNLPYQRLEQIMEYYSLNPNSFASKIGLKRTQNLYDIRDGKIKKITFDLANKISTVFTVVNKDWLLTGEGSMFNNNEEDNNNQLGIKEKRIDEVIQVPEDDYMMVEFEDLETAAGKLGGNDVAELPETKKRLVPKEYATGFYLVVRVYGDSMNDQTYRSILNGDEILIRQYFDFIENLPIRNKLFVIVTEDGSVVKQIKKVDKENKKIICHSFNPTWEDYEVHLDEITQIFTVEKKVKSNIFF